jgi:hypothetical protein
VDPEEPRSVRENLCPSRAGRAPLADAADPRSILDAPITRRLLDLDEPFAVLLAGVLQHLSDEQDPVGVTRHFGGVGRRP